MGRSPGRSGRPWQRFQRLVLNTYGPTCHLCGKPIDLDAPARTPQSFSVDHLDPLSLGGAPLDLDRARPAHYGCNSSRGNRPIKPRLKTSEDW